MACCNGDMMGSMTGLMWIWMIAGTILFISIIVGIIWLVARSADTGRASDGGDAALSTVRERFARGEIDEREYQERRSVLNDTARRR